MHRITILYGRPTDPEAFEKRYQSEHVPLVNTLPGLRRFTLSHPRELQGDVPYLVAELWFDDAEAMKTATKSPEMVATAQHAEGFDVDSRTMFSGEVVEAF